MNKQSFSMNKNAIIIEDIKMIADRLDKAAEQFSGKTILITGGLGFLGRYIVNTFLYLNKDKLKKPTKIIVVDNYITSTNVRLNLFARKKYLRFKKHNIIKPLKISGPIDYIIHAAGLASPLYYQKYPLETIDVAVTGTRNMLELAKQKKVKSILFFSSSEIYGDPPPQEIPTKESFRGNVSSTGERSCYDESKRLGETLCMTYFRLYKTPVKFVRPFNVFGPGMRENDNRVIPNFLYNALSHKPIGVHLNGKQTRAFCYIADAVTGFFQVLLSSGNGEVYNVGNDEIELNMNQLAQHVKKIFEKKVTILNIPYPKNYPLGEPQRRCPDLTKIKKLGYKPTFNLETGLKRTLQWCKDNWTL